MIQVNYRTTIDDDCNFIVEQTLDLGMSWQGVKSFSYRQEANDFINVLVSARQISHYFVLNALRVTLNRINFKERS